MGVDAALMRRGPRDKRTRRFTWEAVAVYVDQDERFLLDCESTGLPMLTRVESYGSLVLSSSEMPQFISEVKTLAGSGASYLAPLLALAEQCGADPTLELHLDGD